MTSYQHTQIGHTILYPLIGMLVLAFAIMFISPVMRIAVVPAIILLITALLFWKLTVTVDDTKIRAAFGPGFIYKETPLSEVQSCEPMRVRFWDGWGIHLTRHGWLYNVSGRNAVAITLRHGKRFCVGTDEPQELVAAIRRFASVR